MKITFYPPFPITDKHGSTFISKDAFVEHQGKTVKLDALCSDGEVCDVVLIVEERRDEDYGCYAEVAFLRAFQVIGYKGATVEQEASEAASWLGGLPIS